MTQVTKQEIMSVKSTSICTKVMPVLLFMLFFQVSFAQYDFTVLTNKLDKQHKKLSRNLSVLIYKDGQIIYEKDYGGMKKTSERMIASCSKWLTAAVVMKYIDQGKLTMNTKIADIIPSFKENGKTDITVKHCLSHTTGIRSSIGLWSGIEHSKFLSLEQEVNFYAKRKVKGKPGTRFVYSNTGLNTLGRVLEIISGKPFNDLMKEELFEPLNMQHTSFASPVAVAAHPSGGAISTAEDYIQFLSMLLNKGMYKGKRILSEQAVTTMQVELDTRAKKKTVPNAVKGFTYASGEWIIEKYANGKTKTVSSPGIFGAWPMVDNCHDYAAIFFIKSLLTKKKTKVYMSLKKSIDKAIGKCG